MSRITSRKKKTAGIESVMPPKDLTSIMQDMNEAIARIKAICIEQLIWTNHLAYSTAVVIIEELGIKITKPKATSYSIPKWKIRLKVKIKKLRSGVCNLKNMKEQKWKNVRSLIKNIGLALEQLRNFGNHKITNNNNSWGN